MYMYSEVYASSELCSLFRHNLYPLSFSPNLELERLTFHLSSVMQCNYMRGKAGKAFMSIATQNVMFSIVGNFDCSVKRRN